MGMKCNSRVIKIGNTPIGGGHFAVIAGPCSIESPEQFLQTAEFVLAHNANIVRGGIYKMRTSPMTFQGLGHEAIELVKTMKAATGAPFIAEITDTRQVDAFYEFVDCYQVGSRNMYNYELIKELGRQDKPVLLKRGFSATVDEWLKAADYLVTGGNENVLLCERGVRSFDTVMRNSLDLATVAYLKLHSQFPVIVDPSHGTGRPDIIPTMANAAVAAGADGIMVEVHPKPSEALSDGFQALTYPDFAAMMDNLLPYLALAKMELPSRG